MGTGFAPKLWMFSQNSLPVRKSSRRPLRSLHRPPGRN